MVWSGGGEGIAVRLSEDQYSQLPFVSAASLPDCNSLRVGALLPMMIHTVTATLLVSCLVA